MLDTMATPVAVIAGTFVSLAFIGDLQPDTEIGFKKNDWLDVERGDRYRLA